MRGHNKIPYILLLICFIFAIHLFLPEYSHSLPQQDTQISMRGHNNTTSLLTENGAMTADHCIDYYSTDIVESNLASSFILASDIISITILSPPEGASLRGIVWIRISASSTQGSITQTEIYVDGVRFAFAADSYCECDWNTTNEIEGNHVLSARAQDETGEWGTRQWNVTVRNVPDIEFITLSNDQGIRGNVTIRTQAFCGSENDTANYSDITCKNISLFINGSLKKSVQSTDSLTYLWDTSPYQDGCVYNLSLLVWDIYDSNNSTSIFVRLDNSFTLSFKSLTNESIIGGHYEVTCNSSSKVASITDSKLFINGILILQSANGNLSYLWDTTIYADNTVCNLTFWAIQDYAIELTTTVLVKIDNIPNLFIHDLTNNSIYSGTVTINVSVTSGEEIRKITLFINGINKSMKLNDTKLVYLWDTSFEEDNAWYNLTIIAMDDSEPKSNKTSLFVYVNNYPDHYVMHPINGSLYKGTFRFKDVITSNDDIVSIIVLANGTEIINVSNTSILDILFDSTTLNDGRYNITFVAFDNLAPTMNSTTIWITIDNSAPRIDVVNLNNGDTITSIIHFSATSSSASGITFMEIYINDVLMNRTSTDLISYSWNTTMYTDNEWFTVRIVAQNKVDMSNETIITVYIDNIPQIHIDGVSKDGTYVGSIPITINATSGDAILFTEVYIDGNLRYNTTASLDTFLWNTTNDNDGLHNLSFKVYDDVSPSFNSTSFSVFVDNIPQFIFSSPTNESMWMERLTFSGSASSGSYLDSIELYKNSSILWSHSFSGVYSADIYHTFNITPWNDGWYNLTVQINDVLEPFSNRSTIWVLVENSAPILIVNSPFGKDIRNGTILVDCKAYALSGIAEMQFKVNGIVENSIASNELHYNWSTLQLEDGNYSITITAINALGSQTKYETWIVLDNVPQFNVQGLVNNTVYWMQKLIEIDAYGGDSIYQIRLEIGSLIKNKTLNSNRLVYTWDTFDFEDGIWNVTIVVIASNGLTNSSTYLIEVRNRPIIDWQYPDDRTLEVWGRYYFKGRVSSLYCDITKLSLYANTGLYYERVLSQGSYNFSIPVDTTKMNWNPNELFNITIVSFDAYDHKSKRTVLCKINNYPNGTIEGLGSSLALPINDNEIAYITAHFQSNNDFNNASMYINGTLFTTFFVKDPLPYAWDIHDIPDDSYNVTFVIRSSISHSIDVERHYFETIIAFHLIVARHPWAITNITGFQLSNDVTIHTTVISGFEITDIEVYLDQTLLIDGITFDEFTISLNTYDYEDGNHSLRIHIINKFYENESVFRFMIFNYPIINAEVIDPTTHDIQYISGMVEISIETETLDSIEHIELYVLEYGLLEYDLITQVASSSLHVFIDTTQYVDGITSFQIKVYESDGDFRTLNLFYTVSNERPTITRAFTNQVYDPFLLDFSIDSSFEIYLVEVYIDNELVRSTDSTSITIHLSPQYTRQWFDLRVYAETISSVNSTEIYSIVTFLPPEIEIIRPMNGSSLYLQPQEIEFNASYKYGLTEAIVSLIDQEGNEYSVVFDLEDSESVETTIMVVLFENLYPGTYTLRITVTSVDNSTAFAQVTLTLSQDMGPIIALLCMSIIMVVFIVDYITFKKLWKGIKMLGRALGKLVRK